MLAASIKKTSGAEQLAILPYPQKHAELVRLKSGKTFKIRLIRPEDEPALMVTNSLLGIGATDTSYTLYLDPTEVDKNGELEIYVDDDSDYDDNLTNLMNYTFDETTLNITNSTVVSGQSGKSATLNGSISLNRVDIPANQQTMLFLNSEHFYEFGSTTTTFNEDSTFISSESTEAGDDGGTWSINGDTLKITISGSLEEGDEPIDTTLAFIYVNTGNEFHISQSIDICEGLPAEGTDDEIGCNEIYQIIEIFFGLDEGSIVNAELIYQLFFERIPAKQTAKISNNSKNPWVNSVPQQIQQYLIKNTKLIQ